MRVSARRRATLGLLLGAALCGATGGSAVAAEDGSAIDAIAVSADGTRWSATLMEPLFHDLRLVPGDVETATLWLRNDHADASTFAVTVSDPRRSGDAADPWFDDVTLDVQTPTGPVTGPLAFTEVLSGTEVASGSLAPGGTTPVTLRVAFPVTATSGNGTGPVASFDLVITMAGATASVPVVPVPTPTSPALPAPAPDPAPPTRGPSGPDLPWTGSDPLGLLLAAGGAILAGSGLAWWSVRRS